MLFLLACAFQVPITLSTPASSLLSLDALDRAFGWQVAARDEGQNNLLDVWPCRAAKSQPAPLWLAWNVCILPNGHARCNTVLWLHVGGAWKATGQIACFQRFNRCSTPAAATTAAAAAAATAAGQPQCPAPSRCHACNVCGETAILTGSPWASPHVIASSCNNTHSSCDHLSHNSTAIGAAYH
jgi:hypothetical protein